MRICRVKLSLFLSGIRYTMSSAKPKENYDFPKTLLEFGYNFDESGELKKLDKKTGNFTQAPFEFHVREDPSYNQLHYEALGEAITEHVYDLLEKEGLDKVDVPRVSNTPKSFAFTTPDYNTSEKLLVLIHGSGVVRAGQWARSIIINKDLKSGTQLSYIRKARDEGYGVVIMNTNDNQRDGDPIKGSETPEAHAVSLWRDYILGTKARHIAIVAHSYGGVVTANLAAQFESEFLARVFAIAFTDSVHSSLQTSLASKLYSHIVKISRNWVSSPRPLDSPLETSTSSDDVARVSAGTQKHELTSWSAHASVFSFLQARLSARPDKIEL